MPTSRNPITDLERQLNGDSSPARNSPAVGGNVTDATSRDPFQGGLNDYVHKLATTFGSTENTYYGTARRPDGSYTIENIPPRDASSGLTSGLEDQRSIGGLETAGESGSAAVGRQRAAADFFQNGRFVREPR